MSGFKTVFSSFIFNRRDHNIQICQILREFVNFCLPCYFVFAVSAAINVTYVVAEFVASILTLIIVVEI